MSTRSATIIRQTTYWGEEAETEELNNRTYAIVLPPVDADNVPIRIGDVLEFKLANEEEQ